MNHSILDSEKLHLAELLEAIQRCVYFLGAAMRHACILAGEPTDSFLKVLSFYEKTGVLESVASWQLCRTARNLAAHDYDIEYAEIADHFNSLQTLIPLLYISAVRFLNYCQETLGIEPKQADFSTEFMLIVKTKQADESGVIK